MTTNVPRINGVTRSFAQQVKRQPGPGTGWTARPKGSRTAWCRPPRRVQHVMMPWLIGRVVMALPDSRAHVYLVRWAMGERQWCPGRHLQLFTQESHTIQLEMFTQ